MDKLIEALNDFYVKEYGSDSEITEIPESKILSLAYTTYDFGDGVERDIQVDFDIVNLKYLNYIDDELVLEEPRSSIDDFIAEIESCDFNDIIRDCVHEGYNRYEPK